MRGRSASLGPKVAPASPSTRLALTVSFALKGRGTEKKKGRGVKEGEEGHGGEGGEGHGGGEGETLRKGSGGAWRKGVRRSGSGQEVKEMVFCHEEVRGRGSLWSCVCSSLEYICGSALCTTDTVIWGRGQPV